MNSLTGETMPDRIRIVAVAEHELFRAGLCLLLSQEKGFEVVGSTSSLPEAVTLVQNKRPDVVLFGLNGEGGIAYFPRFLKASESSRILALSETGDEELPATAIRLGAAGVLSKRTSAGTLVKAVECVHAGEAWLDRSTTARLLRELAGKDKGPKPDPEQLKIASLSEREREVIKLAGAGLKNGQIAKKLFISPTTVHHHLTSIYAKLEVADRMELLIFAYRHGLAELPH